MRRTLPLPLLLVALGACASSERPSAGTAADTTARAESADTLRTATRVGETTGFDVPESVVWDPELDVYFVSNINGNPGAADNNGFIARVQPDSLATFTRLVEGGRNGVTLNAPKGMAIEGDTIWVADITVVRGFNKRTGAPVATIELTGQRPVFLNDVALGIDGIYVTDTNIRFGADGSISKPGVDRIFRISHRRPSVVAQGDSLASPNGITWDSAGTRFIVVSFDKGGVMSWRPGDGAPARIAAGPGQYDGVEVLGDNRYAVTSWADSGVHLVHDGSERKIASGISGPADLGVDRKRNLLLVPHFNDGIVSYWRF